MHFRLGIIVSIVAIMAWTTSTADEDTRTLVRLPVDIRGVMLADMRHHVEALDDVLLSLSVGDFGSAAVFIEEQMGLGSRWVKPLAAKRSMAEPWGIWSLGRDFRATASRLAVTLIKLGNDRSPDAYGEVLSALREVTLRCRGCYAMYRIQ